MSLPLIYIAGPFRGPTPLAVRRNVEAARDLGLRVAEAGGYPIIPHTMTSEFDKLLTDEFWLDGTMELLKRCDAICLTPNWKDSTGAKVEYAYADEEEMPIFVGYDGIPMGLKHVEQGMLLRTWVLKGQRPATYA